MTWWHAVLISLAGLWAGTINTVVGSGTLVTFPVLVALGYQPITATTSNTLGLAPGTIAGAAGYRHELTGYWRSILPYAVACFFGAIGGTVLLLALPKDAFETIVPVLVGLAVVLVIIQPRISGWLTRWRGAEAKPIEHRSFLLLLAIFVVGLYGGYFTAAQGVLFMAVLGLLVNESLQRLNAVKNVLAAVINVIAGTVYAFAAPVDWSVVALLAISSTCGGLLGAKIGRQLSAKVLRAIIIVVGLAAIVQLTVIS